jgi:hypothetical protein
VPGALPSAFCRALDKVLHSVTRSFTECRTLGKDVFAKCRTLGKGGARQRAVSGRLKLTTVNLCRGPVVGTRQRGFFAECQPADTRQRPLYRVPFLGTRQSIFLFFKFWQPNFLWYVPTLCRPTCTILEKL